MKLLRFVARVCSVSFRRPRAWLVIVAMVAFSCVGVPDDEAGSSRSAAVDVVVPPSNVFVDSVRLQGTGGSGQGCPAGWSACNPNVELRAAGAWLYPSGYVLTTFVEATTAGLGYQVSNRRARYGLLDMDSGGTVAATGTLGSGSPMLRGMAATSYLDASGNIDALVAVIDDTPNKGIRISVFQGEATAVPVPSAPVYPSGIAHSAVHQVVPAIEFGRNESLGQNKTLLAYGRYWGGEVRIDRRLSRRSS